MRRLGFNCEQECTQNEFQSGGNDEHDGLVAGEIKATKVERVGETDWHSWACHEG
jgi:hypothetical protein